MKPVSLVAISVDYLRVSSEIQRRRKSKDLLSILHVIFSTTQYLEWKSSVHVMFKLITS